jgi:2-haloacid dehalogenase
MQGLRALVFDVFGTLVDWRGSIAREAREQLAPRGVNIDWHAFADAWRAQYQPAMEEVRSGKIPFSKLDVLHRRNLEVVLKAFGIHDLDEAARVHLNLAWHRLDAWPDVAPGLQRLRERFRIAPAFDCAPAEVLMVAAHSNDLAAAAEAGLRTAHIARPDEKGPGRGEHGPSVAVDIAARNLLDLADQLDARASR